MRISLCLQLLLFCLMGTSCSQESLPEDEAASVSTELAGSNVVATYSDIPACGIDDDGKLYFTSDTGTYYFCTAESLEPLTSAGGEASVGATGPAGPGFSFRDLSMLNASHIQTSASGNTGTNAFASGTGAANLSAPTLIVDAADAALSDITAAATSASATTGLTTSYGCIQVDLQPALSGASLGRGYAYAKIGLTTSTGTANVPLRWETSATGVASSFLLGATLTAPSTTTERIFYVSSEFLGRFVSLCMQGSTSRNYTLKVYQFYVAL